MAYANGIISAPVSIYDIQRAIGSSAGDLGTLCKHVNINQWSKMKPVAFPFIEPDRTQAVSAYGKTLWWWKGHPSYTEVAAGLVIGNYTCQSKCVWITCCGVKFLGLSTKADVLGAFNPLANAYHTGDNSPLANNFSYVPPTGGSSEPFRLVDFKYYWHTANYNVIPDYGTESGTTRVDVNNPQSSKVKCGIMCPEVSNTINSELSFNDLFKEVGSTATFTVVCGKLVSGTNNFTVVNLSIQNSLDTDFFKEIEINLNDSQVYGSTVIVIYCAYILIGTDSYYVPLMQSTGDHPNTTITYAPRRKIYNSWYIDNTTPFYALTFTQKQNYGTAFSWDTVTSMTYFMTSGLMNRWYLKLSMPQKTASYQFGNNAFKIEFTGQFRDSRGQVNLIYYAITSSDTRFVLKNNEVTDNYDWGTTETVVIQPGSGTQECYLAIYDVFADRNAVQTTYGGTIWRVRLFFLNGQQSFSPEPDVEYGNLGSDHLNINVQAINT